MNCHHTIPAEECPICYTLGVESFPKEKRIWTFEDHEQAALHEFLTHIRQCLEGEEDIDINQELELSESDFWECAGSIKFLQGHILKVKWEGPCPKIGCHWHLYYCKLAENIEFKEIEEVLNK